MINNWESLFREHILDRGYNYYRSGAVNSVSKTAEGYDAVVRGTEDYDVELLLDEDNIDDMFCTCPYAEDGNYCKHMAGVLYYLEEQMDNCCHGEDGYDRQQALQETLNQITGEEAKKILLGLAVEDYSIGNRIMTLYSKSIGEDQVAQLKAEVDSIVYRYGGMEGFIDYRNTFDFVSELEDFLFQKGQALIDNHYNMQAFEVVTYVFKVIGNQDMDDSNGGSGSVATLCYDLWGTILDQCNEEEKKEMFRWFRSHQTGYVFDYMDDYLSDFLINYFNDSDLLMQKLAFLDEQIAAAQTSLDCGHSWYACSGHEDNILKRLEVMKRLGLSEKEIKEYRQKFRNFPAVRKLEIDEYLQREEYDNAIEVLVESKKLDAQYPGLVSKYSTMLIDIYHQLNRNRQCKEELEYLVFTCRENNLEYIKMLKECCPEEWDDNLEKLLREPAMPWIKFQLLEQEKMYKRLLDEILKIKSIDFLNQYEKCLEKEFPKEVRQAYIDYVIHKAQRTANRNAYRELVSYLNKIRNYPMCEEAAHKIAVDWKTQYNRRPAMMDELRKGGF